MPQQTTIDLETKAKGPVTCLGQVFASEDARREHFRDLLREKLKDPEFRKIEGFPIGEDEDIIALSDPPYYTACPNPWINDFIAEWEKEKGDRPEEYHREPFAADVSEGKNDPIYNAHSYHTKVPHKAIMRYILHYTEPGDIVFDGFCGTGMTGVAAQLCGDREVVESLGYTVKDDGTILDEEGKPFSKLGSRKAILNDLSPAATYISNMYLSPVNVAEFDEEFNQIIMEVENEYAWVYKTLADDGTTFGKINFTVWSDVFVCPNCTKEIVYWDLVSGVSDQTNNAKLCPYCNAILTKGGMERSFVHNLGEGVSKKDNFDDNESIHGIQRIAKQVPVLINYSIGSKRYEKKPDANDLELIERIDKMAVLSWYPTQLLPIGFNTDQPRISHGLTYVHHFYTKRNLMVFAALWQRTKSVRNHLIQRMVMGVLTAILVNIDKRYKYRDDGKGGIVTGTLYIPSLSQENSVFRAIVNKYSSFKNALMGKVAHYSDNWSINQSSTTDVPNIPSICLDYIFTDPPFGGNIMYSELSIIVESWLGVRTNNKSEAIENKKHNKNLFDYQNLMTDCFIEYYRVLKPGRWMTVEFHNSKNSVWNSIQEALQVAGFVVADVRTLDKKQGSFKQVTASAAVKQDLIISCYKPNGGIEERFIKLSGTEEGVWDFVRTHLKQLPKVVVEKGKMQIVAERQNYLLYDRMVAFYLQRNALVPLSSAEFYKGLEEHFPCRDGMYFLPEQVVEYDKTKMKIPDLAQIEIFITDEVSAIQWLRQLLKDKPQSFQEIHPQFMREIAGWNKTEKSLELSLILEENFLKYDNKSDVPSQIHTYLSTNWKELRNLSKDDPVLKAKAKDRWYVPDPNKLADLEQMREKALLKEFWTYLPKDYKPKKLSELQIEIPDLPKSTANLLSGKRYKVIRAEAVRAGFKYCWQNRDYDTIILVAKRIPSSLLEEDPKLLMYYDQAITRTQ
jgi:DNA modification methylase